MTPTVQTRPDHSPILQTAFAFWNSKVLLTAVQFGLFTALGDRQMSGEELGAELDAQQATAAREIVAADPSLPAAVALQESDYSDNVAVVPVTIPTKIRG